ncbi:hypothetical protein EJ06DRAFT_526610 [Trichodelitschia bisporula]|uniref:Zn(2)-C6 fungal-type domain-containing protein n=1 Tax=Trichodelitschia bisporula TaxID=703511 RepID=A0A6G1I8D9_9PEZI|nr:hypothetical protein EJ06DRAFT_526610 [Trichodelitschia bisporula]
MNGTAGASSSSGPSSAPNTGITVSTTDSSTASGSGSATQRRGHVRKESSGHICTACDQCYRCKVRCSGERPTCERCQRNNSACTYSTGKPLGKPKGSKNKVKRLKTPQESEQQTAIAPADSNHHFDPRHLSTSPRKRSSDGALPLVRVLCPAACRREG